MSESLVPRESSLPALADEIRAEVQAADRDWQSALAHAIRAGELLIEAKAQCRHGEWLPWVERNFPQSERTARAYMRLAANWQGPADLSIEAALRSLGKKVRAEHLERTHEEHIAGHRERAVATATREPGSVVWRKPPPNEELEDIIAALEATLGRDEADLTDAKARIDETRKLLREARARRGWEWEHLLAYPGSQHVTEEGDVYVSPDGDSVVYVGKGEPVREGWSAWGYEAAGQPHVVEPEGDPEDVARAEAVLARWRAA